MRRIKKTKINYENKQKKEMKERTRKRNEGKEATQLNTTKQNKAREKEEHYVNVSDDLSAGQFT